MPTMTLSIPDDLYAVIKQHNEVKWSVIARNAMWEYARKIQLVDSILEKSELKEKDAEDIAKLVKNPYASSTISLKRLEKSDIMKYADLIEKKSKLISQTNENFL